MVCVGNRIIMDPHEKIMIAYEKFIKARLEEIKQDYPSNSDSENMEMVIALWPPPTKD